MREALVGMAKALWYGNYLLEAPGKVGYGDCAPRYVDVGGDVGGMGPRCVAACLRVPGSKCHGVE